jgi:hypothetical protein
MIAPTHIALLLPLAHLGHWYFFPLYALPILLILISALRTTVKERRKARDSQRDSGGPSR